MICSVKRREGGYSHYEAPRAPSPSWARSHPTLGIALGDALPALPVGSRLVGSGPAARGVVCRPGTSVLGLGAVSEVGPGMLVAAGGLVLLLLLWRR